MKIECDELLVICDNCGHAIHVKELGKNSIELNRKNDELVSKQEVIETTKRVYEWRTTNNIEDFKDLLLEYFKNLVPAQPEIIQCRNCKFASGDSRICMKFGHSPIGELDFCAWAERRTDG